MARIVEFFDGVEIEPFIYNKSGSWKLYLLAYKEARETMLNLRKNEVVEFEKTLFANPEFIDDEDFMSGYNFSKNEVKKEEASLGWVNQKISELPKYDPFL